MTSGVNKLKNQVNLNKTLQFTKSSYAYKDPYLANGGLYYKFMNRVKSFVSIRNIENEFVDFKSYHLDSQFREINQSVYKAYAKSDKVNMQRSLSEAMFAHATALRNEKRPNPFLKKINRLTILQSRLYAENDHLLPEEQWAQITVLLKGLDYRGENQKLYTVFERRAADKLDYFDWKLSFMAEEEDFKLMNDTKI